MSPEAPCPRCGRKTDFHEDEMEDVEMGAAYCVECRMKIAEDAYILGIAMGWEEPPDSVKEDEE